MHNLSKDLNLFQVTDGTYYLMAVTSDSQDDMTDCRMYKNSVKSKYLAQSEEALTKHIGEYCLYMGESSKFYPELFQIKS